MNEVDNEIEEEKKKKDEPLPINWDDIENLEDEEEYEVDETADAFTREAPPVPGVYDFLVTVDPEKGITQREIKSRRTNEMVKYFSVGIAFQAKSSDANIDGAMLYVNASSLYNERKKTSTLLTILSKFGVKVNDISSGAQQLKRLREFVNTEPIKPIKVDWELTYKNSDGVYNSMYTSFKEFPGDNSTKTKKKEVFNIQLKDKSYVEARPRLKVLSFAPGSEKETKGGGTISSVAGKSGKVKKEVSAEIADLEASLG